MTGARHAGTHRAATPSPLLRLIGGLLAVGGVAILVAMALDDSPSPARSPQAIAPSVVRPTGAATSAPVTSKPSPAPVPTSVVTSTPRSTPTAEPTQAEPSAPLLPLLVLNNSRINNLASDAADDFRAGGWTVRGTGNFRGRVAMTTVYYEPGQEASARRLMREFGKIRRMSPRFDGLPGHGLTVVVTRDYTTT